MKEQRTALIVEDDPISRRLLEVLLKKQHFSVETACDGAEGIQKIILNPNYDVVLLDLMMPVVTGQDLLRVISVLQERGLMQRVPPVIIESAASSSSTFEELLRIPFVAGVIRKPINHAELNEYLHKLEASC